MEQLIDSDDEKEEVEKKTTTPASPKSPKKNESSSSSSSSKKKDDSDSDSSSDSSSSSDSDGDSPPKKKKKIILKKGGGKKKKKGSDSDSSDSSDSDDEAARKKKEADEKKFIDSDDDNADLLDEYNNQKEFEDEVDPYRDDSGNPIDPEDVGGSTGASRLYPKKFELPDNIDPKSFKAVVTRMAYRKHKQGELNDSEKKEVVQTILSRMLQAAQEDDEARARRKPAVAKLKLVDEAIQFLRRKDLHYMLFETGLLDVLTRWLKPNSVDKSLPAQSIRTKIIEVLPTLGVEAHHLEATGFGKVIHFLSKHPKESKANREKCKNMIQEWSRAIFRKNARYDDVRVSSSPSPSRPRTKPATSAMGLSPQRALLDMASDKKRKKKKKKKDKEKKNFRAAIPAAQTFEFKVAAANRHNPDDAKIDILRKSDARKELERRLLKRRKK